MNNFGLWLTLVFLNAEYKNERSFGGKPQGLGFIVQSNLESPR